MNTQEITKERLENIKKRNGFYVLNEFEDEVKPKISATEYSVFMSLWRLLYGWQKLADFVTNKTLQTKTGLSENTILGAIKQLISYNIIKTKICWQNGFKYQFIEINEMIETYILPAPKEKLLKRVDNFLKGKKEKVKKSEKVITQTTKEVYKLTPEFIQFIEEIEKKPTSNLEVDNLKNCGYQTSKTEVTTTSNLEVSYNKHTSLKTNLKTFIHTEEKKEQVVSLKNEIEEEILKRVSSNPHLQKLITPVVVEEKKDKTLFQKVSSFMQKPDFTKLGVVNDFKNFDKNAKKEDLSNEKIGTDDFEDEEEIKQKNKAMEKVKTEKQTEKRNVIDDILQKFGVKTKLKGFNLEILDLDKNTIYDSIEKVKNMKSCQNPAGYLVGILNKIVEANKTAYAVVPSGDSSVFIAGEKEIIDFIASKKMMIGQNPVIENALEQLLIWFNQKVGFLDEIKTLNISNEQLKSLFEKAEKDLFFKTKFGYDKKDALFLAFNNKDFRVEKDEILTQNKMHETMANALKDKKIPVLSGSSFFKKIDDKKDDSFLTSVFKKAENLANKVNSYLIDEFDDNEVIPQQC